jgi:Fic family protein
MQVVRRMTQNDPTLRRICAEYLEMPGLRLTLDQARRLWGLDEATCAASLRRLVEMRFLVETKEHRFARFSEEAANAPRKRTARAGLNHAAHRRTRHANVG